MMLLKPGASFAGRYEVVRALSTGGMGVVYEVLHRDTQRRRALKIMLPSLLADDDMRARFAREAIVTANIESEHLVEVFDAGVEKESGCPFLVMELLRGEDLGARLLRDERTSPRDLLEIFDQLTRALTRTHEAGIVHRDLKPENIFVTRRDDGTLRIKILDFGIAKLVDRSTKNTRSVGTPLYMAPEQMTGRGIGAAADLYALAQIAFTLLVGAPYFQKEADAAENVLGLMHAVSLGTVEPATVRGEALGVHLPPAFDGWFRKATLVDLSQRFASARQQTDALHAVLDDAPERLPVSSGTKRRAAAFGATEAMVELVPKAGAEADISQAPLAPARLSDSAAPARTSVSGGASGVNEGGTTAGPSSRTLATGASSPARGRSYGFVIAFGVVAVAVAAIGLAIREPALPSASAPTEPPAAPSALAAAPRSSSSAPTGPLVEVAPTEVASAPPVEQPSASAAASEAPPKPVPPKKGEKSGSPAATPGTAPKTPPAAPSTPPPPAGTVWSGPRK